MGRGDDEDGLAALDRTMAAHARGDDGPGMAWLVVRGNEVHVGAAGSIDGAGRVPVAPDTIFRISSVTKPVAAVAALTLVDDGTVALDDPVDDLLPELADRQVIVRDDRAPGRDRPRRAPDHAARPAHVPLGVGLRLRRDRPADGARGHG